MNSKFEGKDVYEFIADLEADQQFMYSSDKMKQRYILRATDKDCYSAVQESIDGKSWLKARNAFRHSAIPTPSALLFFPFPFPVLR